MDKHGWLFKRMAIIPVDRKRKNKEAVTEAVSVLKNNGVIGIFPEATINRGNDLTLPFKIGSVKMAYDTNSYLIPFVITGKYKIFNNKLKIEFLKPYKVKKDLTEENNKLRNIIEKRLEEGNGNSK